jgi:hypothetical protein
MREKLDIWLGTGHSKGKVKLLAFQECNFGSNLQDRHVVNLNDLGGKKKEDLGSRFTNEVW